MPRNVSDVLFNEELIIELQYLVKVLCHRLHNRRAKAIDAVIQISNEEEAIMRLIHRNHLILGHLQLWWVDELF